MLECSVGMGFEISKPIGTGKP